MKIKTKKQKNKKKIIIIMIADNKVSKCSKITKMTHEAIAKFSNTCSYHILVFSVINC